MPKEIDGVDWWLYSGIRATDADDNDVDAADLVFAELGMGPTTGATLTARSVDTGDPLVPRTNAAGIPGRFRLLVEEADASADGGVTWFDIGTTERAQVRRATLAAAATSAQESATSAGAAQSAAGSAAQARDAADSAVADVRASDPVTLATKLFGAEWQTAATLVPEVIPAGSGGSIPADLEERLLAVEADAASRAIVVWRNADGTWPDEPTGPGQVFLADDQPSLPAPVWTGNARRFRLRIESTV